MIVALLIYLVLLALIEEAVFRGLLMNGIGVAVRSDWLAVGITAVLVGVPYFFAEGAGALGILSGVLSGVMYGAAFLATQNIWLGAGLRAAWNFVQGPLLGFPVSATMLVDDPLIHQMATGARWLTGGVYGPEASVPGLVIRLVVIAYLIRQVKTSRSLAGRDGQAA
nr:CPBP family intramembrane glutamic endopeptidase [Kineosporia babensis]